jgi:hypothetical protein
MSSETIVFIHKGYSTCLYACILTARNSNPDSEIFLIGDAESNNIELLKLAKCKHVNIDNYLKSATDFSQIYKHDGNNPVEYELFCIQRWFVLRDFLVEQNRQTKILYLDSDAYLYDRTDSIFPIIGSKIALSQKISPAFTYFGSLTELEKFCSFIMKSYSEERAHKKLREYVTNFGNNGMPHISDMTLFGEYANSKGKGVVLDLRIVTKNKNFYCDNYSYPQGMEMGIVGKKIVRDKDGTKFFISKVDKVRIPVGGIHFQGLMKTACLLHTEFGKARMLIKSEIRSGNFRLLKYLKFLFFIVSSNLGKRR